MKKCYNFDKRLNLHYTILKLQCSNFENSWYSFKEYFMIESIMPSGVLSKFKPKLIMIVLVRNIIWHVYEYKY